MSELNFCVFCDTIVFSSDQLSDHLSQHLATEEDGGYNSLSDIERQFVDNFVKYERQLNLSMSSMTLMIGCPACDSLINCYHLIPNQRQFKHLKCLPFEGQRDHCYQHLGYYPFVCQYKDEDKTGEEVCGRQLITMAACERHLMTDHKFDLTDKEKDIFDILSLHFEYNPIEKIDDLINNQLNSKINVNISATVGGGDGGGGRNQTDLSPIMERNDFLSNIGLTDGIHKKIDFDLDSDLSVDMSFHYTSEALAKSYPSTAKKRRGRPPKNRYLEAQMSASLTPVCMAEEELSEPEEVVDLTHRRQYINWFTQTKATKFPYFPQKDDEVYYLPYGHQLYKEEVMGRGLYNQSNRNYTMRCFNFDKILAKVAKIDFLFKERRKTQTVIRCIYITLRPYDEKYGTIIHVKYHDMEGVLDFIVLKEHYEMSAQKLWSIGEEFRSIIDDKYWFGVVIGYNNADYSQKTLFKKIQVQWFSNNSVDFLSPWDLEPIGDSKQFNRYSFMSLTEEDRLSFFSRQREEWPDYNEEKELKRLAKGLKVIYKMDKTMEFPLLQDLTDSRYREKILYPVDMKTFLSRIENHYYRRHLAIKYDIKFMESNIRKLIKSVKRDPEYRFDEFVAKRLKYHTKFVTALSLLFIDTHECKNPYDLYPHIDDYLETHDVKCYSAKRVHLNSRKKYPNTLPVPHKRLPKKRPQSIGDSIKTLKIFKALSNTETLGRSITSKPRIETISTPLPQLKNSPIEKSEELIVPEANDSIEQNCGYSSDVSRSENEYQLECSETVSISDTNSDPDFKTNNYFKDKF